MIFFVCLSEMLRQKKCVGCIAGVFIEMSALNCKHGESVTFKGVGISQAWSQATMKEVLTTLKNLKN